MPDMMQAGSTWQQGVRDAAMSHPVVYTRRGGSGFTLNPSATAGRTLYQVADSSGFLVETESRDFLFLGSYLVLNSAQEFPQSGDLITEVVNGVSRTFQVAMILFRGKQACWRWSDSTGLTMRVHTKALSGG